jgi:hypothetical protein
VEVGASTDSPVPPFRNRAGFGGVGDNAVRPEVMAIRGEIQICRAGVLPLFRASNACRSSA